MRPAIRTLIADDEAFARRRLRTLLAEDPGIEIVAECDDGPSTVAAIREARPELVFLDIKMPELDGFEVLAAVGAEHTPVVVFVTAFDDFAVRAFEVHAVDYLLKPFDRARFRDTLQRAKRQVRTRTIEATAEQLHELMASLQPAAPAAERLPVRTEGRVRFLETRRITAIRADDDVARINVGSEEVAVRETLTRLEERLPAGFLRVHRSAIVNLANVVELQPWFGGDYIIILTDGTRITTGRTYRDRVKALLQ